MAAITGMVVEVVGVRHAAALERQAQTTYAHGAYSSEVTRAGAGLEAGNLGVQARKLSGLAAARGALTATLGQIYGARTRAIQQAQAGQLFGALLRLEVYHLDPMLAQPVDAPHEIN